MIYYFNRIVTMKTASFIYAYYPNGSYMKTEKYFRESRNLTVDRHIVTEETKEVTCIYVSNN